MQEIRLLLSLAAVITSRRDAAVMLLVAAFIIALALVIPADVAE